MVIVILNDHSHDVDLETSLDFLNTLSYDDGLPKEHFPTASDAASWLREQGLLHADEAVVIGDRQLDRLRRVRAALREVTDAVAERRAADPRALETVNSTLRRRETVVLVPASDGVGVSHRHEGNPLDDALARLATPIVDEIASGHPDRLRICANDECRWVFFDSSRAARRRWCDMSSCGNRAKAARHRARLKGA